MTELQRYLAEEIAEDHADGLVSRREALRRLGLLGLKGAAAASLLAAITPPPAGARTAAAAAARRPQRRSDRPPEQLQCRPVRSCFAGRRAGS